MTNLSPQPPSAPFAASTNPIPPADRTAWGKLFGPHSAWQDPMAAAKQMQSWQGRGSREVMCGLLPRLEAELALPTATFTLDLSLNALRLKLPSVGERACLVLSGQCGAELPCVRCGQAINVNFAYHRVLVLCSSDREAEAMDRQLEQDPEAVIVGLPTLSLSMDHCDTVVVSDAFSIRDCLEDELLLSLPGYPRHERCPSAAGEVH